VSRPLWPFLLLLACGAPEPTSDEIVYSPCAPVSLAPEPDTTESERASILDAVALWRDVGVTALTMSEDQGTPAVPLRFRDAAAVFRGIYEPSSGLVSINRGLDGTDRTVTIAHELGHALGLPHVPASERASVMNPGNLTVLPTAEDVAVLQQRWGCPL
jgi:hypothetical protein